MKEGEGKSSRLSGSRNERNEANQKFGRRLSNRLCHVTEILWANNRAMKPNLWNKKGAVGWALCTLIQPQKHCALCSPLDRRESKPHVAARGSKKKRTTNIVSAAFWKLSQFLRPLVIVANCVCPSEEQKWWASLCQVLVQHCQLLIFPVVG